MSYKVLFLETELFYRDMIDSSFFKGHLLEFDGGKHYKNETYFEKYDLVVYTIFSSPVYNLILQKCKRLGIPSLLLFDGICEFSNFTKNKKIINLGFDNYHPIIADNVAVIGDEAKNYFNAFNCTSYKYLPPRALIMNNKLPFPNGNGGYDFLITTANTAYYDDEEKNALILILKKLVNELKQTKFNYCFRLFDESLISALNVPASINFVDGDFNSVLLQSKAVITTPSSILLSAMFHERPVALLSYRDSPMFIQSGWLLHMGVSFKSLLNSMHTKDTKRMTFQLAQVQANLESDTLPSIEKLQTNGNGDEQIKFIDKNMYNMLNSNFNFNMEHSLRKLFWFIKANRFFRFIKPITNYLKR